MNNPVTMWEEDLNRHFRNEIVHVTNKHIVALVAKNAPANKLSLPAQQKGQTKNRDNTNCCSGCGATGTLIHCWPECKIVQTLWKTVWQFLISVFLPYDPCIYPNELKTYVYTQKIEHRCLQQLYSQLPNLEASMISF